KGIKKFPLHLTNASTLAEALPVVADGGVDLVVLDLFLSDSHGFETLDRIYEVAPHVSVIVLADTDNEDLYIQAVHPGAQDYLVKNRVRQGAIMRAIGYAIERRTTQEALARGRDLLRVVIDNLPDLIYVKDTRSRYSLTNRHQVKFVGAQAKEDVVGKTVH